jgi:hypothetical protein
MRAFALLLLAALSGGCASTWDTVTSRKFRQKPFDVMFKSEDPLTVMKISNEGDERAHAMQRLKEPIRNGGTSGDQDEAINLLSAAAVSDPSPVVRVAAIDALGRFQDERAAGILITAYNAGDGIPAGVEKPKRRSRPLDPDDPMLFIERYSLRGPVGYADEVASAIHSRAITALAGTGRPEAMPVVALAAQGGGDQPIDRDTQLAALRGLAKMRTPESVSVLVTVMKAEKGKDPALTARAHESLKNLTGKDYPNDPQAWETAMKSGTATIVPEPTMIQQVGLWISK